MNAGIRSMVGVCSAVGLLLLAGGAVHADDAVRSGTVRLERADANTDRAATTRTRSFENQSIVIERTGEPRIEVTSRNGQVVVKVDGVERVRAEPDDEWRSTNIHNDAGELIARITRDPATGRVSVDGPGMAMVRSAPVPPQVFYGRGGDITPRVLDLQLADPTPVLPVMMGIMMGSVDGALAHHLGIEPGAATLITGIVPGSPAEKAGLQEHDIVLTLDGNTAGPNDIHTLLSTKSPGDAVTLRIRRAGEPEPKTVTIELARSTRAMGNVYDQQRFAPPSRRSAGDPSALGSQERQMLRQAAPEPPGTPRTPASPESSTRGRAQDSDAIRELQSEVRALRERIESERQSMLGQSKQASLDQAVENIAALTRELTQKQAELARLRGDRIMQQFEAMGAEQGDIDFTLPRMLIEMMLEEEGQPTGRRYVFQAPGQHRTADGDTAMRLLAEEMRAGALAERDRLREALSTSRDREQELTERLERMERQLQSLMTTLERVVGTQADGVKPGDRSPE